MRELELCPESLRKEYQVQRLLGAGGMGAVFLGSHPGTQKPCALKILQSHASARSVQRMLKEAKLLSQVRHPNLCEIYDGGVRDGIPYLALELVEGEDLSEWEDPDSHPDQIQAVLFGVASALDALHGQGILHRDVKPANLMRTSAGRPVLMDLGLARESDVTRMTETGALVGTLGFLAPEVLAGESEGAAADWYALGVTLYQFLEGHLPYTSEQIMGRIGTDLWVLPELSPRWQEHPLGRLCLALMDPDPKRRPRGEEALRACLSPAMEPVLPEVGVPSPEDSRGLPRSGVHQPISSQAVSFSGGTRRGWWVLWVAGFLAAFFGIGWGEKSLLSTPAKIPKVPPSSPSPLRAIAAQYGADPKVDPGLQVELWLRQTPAPSDRLRDLRELLEAHASDPGAALLRSRLGPEPPSLAELRAALEALRVPLKSASKPGDASATRPEPWTLERYLEVRRWAEATAVWVRRAKASGSSAWIPDGDLFACLEAWAAFLDSESRDPRVRLIRGYLGLELGRSEGAVPRNLPALEEGLGDLRAVFRSFQVLEPWCAWHALLLGAELLSNLREFHRRTVLEREFREPFLQAFPKALGQDLRRELESFQERAQEMPLGLPSRSRALAALRPAPKSKRLSFGGIELDGGFSQPSGPILPAGPTDPLVLSAASRASFFQDFGGWTWSLSKMLDSLGSNVRLRQTVAHMPMLLARLENEYEKQKKHRDYRELLEEAESAFQSGPGLLVGRRSFLHRPTVRLTYRVIRAAGKAKNYAKVYALFAQFQRNLAQLEGPYSLEELRGVARTYLAYRARVDGDGACPQAWREYIRMACLYLEAFRRVQREAPEGARAFALSCRPWVFEDLLDLVYGYLVDRHSGRQDEKIFFEAFEAALDGEAAPQRKRLRQRRQEILGERFQRMTIQTDPECKVPAEVADFRFAPAYGAKISDEDWGSVVLSILEGGPL